MPSRQKTKPDVLLDLEADNVFDAQMDWRALVAQLEASEDAGIEQLYKLFGRGVRSYLSRQVGSRDVEDKVHETLFLVVNAIQRGDLREPERLAGLVLTISRRQVAAYIEQAARGLGEQAAVEAGFPVADAKPNPEAEGTRAQKSALMKGALAGLSDRDREVLVRFYLREQPQEQICREMGLSITQFRLVLVRSKTMVAEMAKKKLASSGLFPLPARDPVGSDEVHKAEGEQDAYSLIQTPVVSLLMEAAAAFQDIETGRAWLSTPMQSLGNVAPLTLFSTAAGREIIANELGLIQNGMF